MGVGRQGSKVRQGAYTLVGTRRQRTEGVKQHLVVVVGTRNGEIVLFCEGWSSEAPRSSLQGV